MKITPGVVLFFTSITLAFAAGGMKLPRSTPEAQGMSSAALLRFVDAAEQKITSLHSVMILRHGHVVAEGWWTPYAAEEPHQLFSLSKSFTSTAVGLAIEAGKLSVEDPVLKFFPDEAPEKPSANLRAMRVRDLLTMSTGHHNEDIQAFPYNSDESVVKKFLALPVTHKPGTFFVYNTPATYMLSAIVQKVTGQAVVDYLRPRLFEPLGIEHPLWEASKQGVSMGGFGLNVRTEDIARFGQLYLQGGKWQGRQLVPAAWTEMATSRWMSNGSNPASDWEQGYGFQFWRCRYGAFRGDGAHGQFCVVLPQHDTVIAITAGTRDLQGVLTVIWEHLLPALPTTKSALAADTTAHAQLQQRLGALKLKTPVAVSTPGIAEKVMGRRFVFPTNPFSLESIEFSQNAAAPESVAVSLSIAGAEQRLTCSPGTWQKAVISPDATQGVVAASGAWTAADTYTLEVVRYRTPFATRYQLQFADDRVMVRVQPNVGAGAGPLIVGKAK